jgi:hypothetical protein
MVIFHSYVKLPEGSRRPKCDITVEQYGDDNNPRTGNPVLNQAVFHGMIEGWLFHSAQYFTLVMVMLKNGEDGPEPSRYGNCSVYKQQPG